MTTAQMILTVGAVVLGTMATRFLPFLLFPASKPTPRYVQYLGRVLPYAVMGLLLIYCLKEVRVTAWPYGIPELIGLAVTAALQLWRKNMLLSNAAGTVLYMALVQGVFV